MQNYKNILKGKIVIENFQEKEYTNIHGYIKLQKDPKIERFGIENIVVEQSILRNTSWVLGLVLFSKEDSMKKRNILKNPKTNLFFSKRIKFMLLFFLIEIVLITMVTIKMKIFILNF